MEEHVRNMEEHVQVTLSESLILFSLWSDDDDVLLLNKNPFQSSETSPQLL